MKPPTAQNISSSIPARGISENRWQSITRIWQCGWHRGYDEYLEKREELIRTYKEQGRRKEIQEALKQLQWKPDEAQMPEDLCYLTGKYLEAYLHDVEICQQFARRNREKMAEILLERTGLTGTDAFHTIHNYIDTNEMILRKGAIAAHKGERVLIPINMRDGSILAVGKGNPEWNDSAPHGSRTADVAQKSEGNPGTGGIPEEHGGNLYDFRQRTYPGRGADGVQIAG